MCKVNDAAAAALRAQASSKNEVKAQIEAEKAKMQGIVSTYDECLTELNCVINKLSDQHTERGKPFDDGNTIQYQSEISCEKSKWEEMIIQADKSIEQLILEINDLNNQANALAGTSCGVCDECRPPDDVWVYHGRSPR